jgi:hypothetical protein
MSGFDEQSSRTPSTGKARRILAHRSAVGRRGFDVLWFGRAPAYKLRTQKSALEALNASVPFPTFVSFAAPPFTNVG